MSQTFAQVVEDVKQLSQEEKQELQELLRMYLIEERRQEIRKNSEDGLEELRDGKLTFTSDNEKLKEQLSHD
jgi:hypothetical protein